MVHCTICGNALQPHDCGTGCDWLECVEPDCDARYFDVHRGLLLRKDRTVIAWADDDA